MVFICSLTKLLSHTRSKQAFSHSPIHAHAHTYMVVHLCTYTLECRVVYKYLCAVERRKRDTSKQFVTVGYKWVPKGKRKGRPKRLMQTSTENGSGTVNDREVGLCRDV